MSTTGIQDRIVAPPRRAWSAVGVDFERNLTVWLTFYLHPAVDRFEDPWCLIDPPSLAAGHLDQVSALHEGIDRGVGSRASHSRQFLGSSGPDDRNCS